MVCGETLFFRGKTGVSNIPIVDVHNSKARCVTTGSMLLQPSLCGVSGGGVVVAVVVEVIHDINFEVLPASSYENISAGITTDSIISSTKDTPRADESYNSLATTLVPFVGMRQVRLLCIKSVVRLCICGKPDSDPTLRDEQE